MKKIVQLIKQILYFIIGYIVFTSIFFIVNILIFKSTEYTIDIKAGILETMKSLSLLYISLHLLALTINATYNTIIVKKLNEATESMRKEIKQKQNKVIKIRNRITALTLIVSLIFIGTYLTINLRETYIIYKFKTTQIELISLTNFYTKKEYYVDGEIRETKEIYRKDNKSISKYSDGSYIRYCCEDEDGLIEWYIRPNIKRAIYRKSEDDFIVLPSGFDIVYGTIGVDEMESKTAMFWDSFNIALQRKITTGKIGDYDCYIIDGNYINKKDYIQVGYISKEEDNELMRKWNPKSEYILTEYSIGTVTDENIQMPDIEGYEILDHKTLINQ